jgi:uncharacterized protein (TIGR00159 family)
LPLLFKILFLDISWVDIIDILFVSLLIYNFYKLVQGTVAFKAFVGFLLLYFIYLMVKATEMELLTAILGEFMGVGVIAAVILFQQELRKFLTLISKSTALNQNLWDIFRKKDKSELQWDVSPILDSIKSLASSNTGALIVICKDDNLDKYAQTGDILDAQISMRLLISIFFKNSPLHDGAVIIINDRIKAARCILPVSEATEISASLGLRHRAGVGITEATNTLVLIVSEETGQLSVCQNGKIFHNISIQAIRKKLREYYFVKTEEG